MKKQRIWKFVILSIVLFSSVANAQTASKPNVIVSSSGVVRVGETITFTANIEPLSASAMPVYFWTVTGGKIETGQGTPIITVQTKREDAGKTITATIEVGGVYKEKITASETVAIAPLPEAVKVNELSARTNCEEVSANLDSFFIELNNNPNDSGVIIVYSDKPNQFGKFNRELQIKSFLNWRKYDESRVRLIRGEYRDDAKIEFWRVPAGAEMPEFSGKDWSFDLSDRKEPFIFGTEYADGMGGCDGNLDMFAEFLKANPQMRGNIVIGESSQTKFRKAEKEIRLELAAKNIPPSRIKTFFVKVKPNLSREYLELWLVPPSR